MYEPCENYKCLNWKPQEPAKTIFGFVLAKQAERKRESVGTAQGCQNF